MIIASDSVLCLWGLPRQDFKADEVRDALAERKARPVQIFVSGAGGSTAEAGHMALALTVRTARTEVAIHLGVEDAAALIAIAADHLTMICDSSFLDVGGISTILPPSSPWPSPRWRCGCLLRKRAGAWRLGRASLPLRPSSSAWPSASSVLRPSR